MAVLHDYFCSEHGIFEAWEAKCPMKLCKGEISRVFLQPVSLKSDKTKATDKNLEGLAQDFGSSHFSESTNSVIMFPFQIRRMSYER